MCLREYDSVFNLWSASLRNNIHRLINLEDILILFEPIAFIIELILAHLVGCELRLQERALEAQFAHLVPVRACTLPRDNDAIDVSVRVDP